MSKNSTKKSASNSVKKSKDKPRLKIYIWSDLSVTPDQSQWNNEFVIQYLQNFELTKAWKGKLVIYSESIVIKSKNKMFSRIYEVKNLIGYLESPFNKKIILLGILGEGMTYLLIRCHEISDKIKIIKELTVYKTSNEESYSTEQLNTPNENMILPSIETTENKTQDVNNIENEIINPISSNETFVERQSEEPMREEIALPSSYIPYKNISKTKKIQPIIMNTELVDNTIDSFQEENVDSDSENIMWIENTKYIDYAPSLGMHVQTDFGSIYMYCAHQVIPKINECYSNDSDSD